MTRNMGNLTYLYTMLYIRREGRHRAVFSMKEEFL